MDGKEFWVTWDIWQISILYHINEVLIAPCNLFFVQIEWVLFALSCNCCITLQHFHNEEAAQSSSRQNISNCEIISYETNNV